MRLTQLSKGIQLFAGYNWAEPGQRQEAGSTESGQSAREGGGTREDEGITGGTVNLGGRGSKEGLRGIHQQHYAHLALAHHALFISSKFYLPIKARMPEKNIPRH
eukprot:TRINITY_DN5082_c0_g1_i2.p1 TRINITY_DN5082_c0_g1~~TRINITY_DN5082_c0_g1_i2.p1  ORF type:complete len:105 (-),score=9.23 TRINITY_DN5082_c0_g1_i2:298-612(-)